MASSIMYNLTLTRTMENTTSLEDEAHSTDNPAHSSDNPMVWVAPFTGTLNIPSLSTYFVICCNIVRMLFSVAAIMGNGLTVHCIIKFPNLRTTTNTLIASLAVLDCTAGLLSVSLIINDILGGLKNGSPVLTVFNWTCFAVLMRMNMFHITWIAVDRFLYIAYALRYPVWITQRKILALITGTWLLVLGDTVVMIYFIVQGFLGPVRGRDEYPVNLTAANLMLYYYMPQVLVIVAMLFTSYTSIACIAAKQARSIATQNQQFNTIEQSVHSLQKKIAKMTFSVLAAFLVTSLPMTLNFAIAAVATPSTAMFLYRSEVFLLFFSISHFINPVIYAFKSEQLGKAFKKVLHISHYQGQILPIAVPMHHLNGLPTPVHSNA